MYEKKKFNVERSSFGIDKRKQIFRILNFDDKVFDDKSELNHKSSIFIKKRYMSHNLSILSWLHVPIFNCSLLMMCATIVKYFISLKNDLIECERDSSDFCQVW